MANFIKIIILITSCLSSYSYDLVAQGVEENMEENDEKVEEVIEDVSLFEFTLDGIVPLGNFGTNLDKNLTGYTVTYLNQREAKSYSFYGIQMSRYGLGALSGTISSSGVAFTDRTNSVMVSLHGLYRQFTPFYLKRIEPFFELAIGPQFLYTGTSTTFFDDNSSTEYNFEETDFGLSYGIGVGATIKVVPQFFVLVKAHYFGGTSVNYLLPSETLQTEFPADSFRLRSSQLNYIKLQIGLTYSY